MKGFVHHPKKYSKAVIFLHGFPGSAIGTSATLFAKEFGKRYLTLRFDFSHGRISQGKFEDKLMSKEVEDIQSAIDFLYKEYNFDELTVVGHSTGAIDLALYAHKDKRIDKVVIDAGTYDLKRGVRYDFDAVQVHSFWTRGYVQYNRPGHWAHKKKIKKAFYDEFFTLDIPKAITKYKGKLLVIHGEKDTGVPVFEARELYKNANVPKKLVIVKDGDHRFTGKKVYARFVKHVDAFIRN